MKFILQTNMHTKGKLKMWERLYKLLTSQIGKTELSTSYKGNEMHFFGGYQIYIRFFEMEGWPTIFFI